MRISQPTTQLYVTTPAGVAAVGSVGASDEASPGDHVHAGYGQLIQSVLLAAPQTNVTFTAIPQTFAHLRAILSGETDDAAVTDFVVAQLNGDTGLNYSFEQFRADATTLVGASSNGLASARVALFQAASATAGNSGIASVLFADYASGTLNKAYVSEGGASQQQNITLLVGFWNNAAAITSIKFFPAAGTNFTAGTRIDLYGVN